MAENLIERVKMIEADADRIVAEARECAERIEQSAVAEADALRERYEAEFRRDMEAFKAEQEQHAARRRAELDERARVIGDTLRSVDPEAAREAIGLVVKHFREG